MKVEITITKAEKDETLDLVVFDPCVVIDCREISCEECPLHSAAYDLRKASEAFVKVLEKMKVEGE